MISLHRLLLVLLFGLLPSAVLPAQEPSEQEPPTGAQEEAEGAVEGDELDFLDEPETTDEDDPDLPGEPGELEFIEGLLEEGEESLDTGFVYDAGGRRDPFRSLLRATDTVERSTGPRPEGIPGLLIDEITVTGVWMFPEGPVAQVQSSDNPMSFLLRPGTRVFDGEVTSITFDRDTGGKVVFRQIVRDPTSPKPFREVVRRVEQ